MLFHRTLVVATTLAVTSLLAYAASPVVGESEAALRRQLAWQVALDHIGFSPGLIDGRGGAKTVLATQEFQRVRGLPITGKLDSATAAALQIDPDNVIGRYTIIQADLDAIGPLPKTWIERSKLSQLGHEALENVIAEKFHCSTGLLAALNPGKTVNRMRVATRWSCR